MLHQRPDPVADGVPRSPPRPSTLGDALVACGLIDIPTRDWADARVRRATADIGEIVVAHGLVTEDAVLRCRADLADMHATDDLVPDPVAVSRLGAAFCATHGVVPLAPIGALRPLAIRTPERFPALRAAIEATLGPVAPIAAGDTAIIDALGRAAGAELAHHAETRAPPSLSCRTLATGNGLPWSARIALAVAIVGLLALFPGPIIAGLTLLALAVTAINLALTTFACLPAPTKAGPTDDPTTRPVLARLPVVTILLPLFREEDIAALLVDRVARLDYPSELLDVILVVEDDDRVTAQTLTDTRLPPWARVVRAPHGTIRTKPRAMNHALAMARGSIIGIYDAEDAPAPDQLRQVVDRFARSGPRVACLQGRLGFYNVQESWITRLFTVDYAAWFHVMLPALARLGWPIPLGGTTLFLRRSVIEEVGGWDAHNVTEDADLGLRLARAGYETQLIDTRTMEEAPSRAIPWIRQRSRWQKGYALTWASHMRAPRALLRDLGLWRFVGVQVLFLGSLGAACLAPFLWSLLILSVGLTHPIQSVLPGGVLTAIFIACALALGITMLASAIGLRRIGTPRLLPWLPLLPVYHGLASISVLKAGHELITRPFFWDKTSHGHSLRGTSRQTPPSRPESCLSRVS